MPRSIDKFTLTSNRDEAPERKTLAPKIYDQDGTQLLFPKDELAGGTWIGVSEKKRLVCLLNGGFEAHKRKQSYRMSRGIIVTNLLTAESATEKVDQLDLHDIEPFTLILVDWNLELKLYELVWDGMAKHFSEKPLAPHIWSSSLLYSTEIKKKREQWFSSFLFEDIRPTNDAILEFHKTAGEGDLETNLIMDRGFVKTKSISQYSTNAEIPIFRYEDLENEQVYKLNF